MHSAMNNVKKKRGLFASRAHSFKENILDALKNSQVATPQRKTRPEKNAIILAKKTSSTDNLTGHLGTAKTTDCLVKEVQFALKYFQDVVSKQTYEMLPGCATVVLETVLAIQAFAGNIEDPIDSEVNAALLNAFKAVSVLTNWADSVIIDGQVEASDDYIENVIEPVRRAVIVVVNCISVRLGNQSLARGNSLPDITSDPGHDDDLDSAVALSQSSDSILDLSLVKPPLFPKHSLNSDFDVAPPLPPKHMKPRFDKSFEDLIAHSYSLRHMEWLNNAALENTYPTFEIHRPRQSLIRRTQLYNNHSLDKSLPSPKGLDTTLPDQSFEYSNETNSSPTSISKESLTNTSFDDTDLSSHKLNSLSLFSRSWSSRERSNTSSPSFETLSFSSHLSDPLDRDQPPAIPRKSRDSSRKSSITPSWKSQGPESTRPFPNRKLSQYDNIPDSESYSLRQMYDMKLDNDNFYPPTPQCFNPHLQMSKSDSFTQTFSGRSPNALSIHKKPAARAHSVTHTTWSKLARSRYQNENDTPPPLPPKKRNIMSYMEMFGKSIIPTGEDLLQGIFHPHDLLHNVWQQNFHEYSEYAPSSLLNFPFIDQPKDPQMENFPSSIHPQTLHPYINFQAGSNLDTPPALPPKRCRSRPGSFRSSGSSEAERRIPIIHEDTGNRISQLSDNSASSGSSSEMPRLAEITKLSRLSVPIPIQRTESPETPLKNEGFESTLLDEITVSEHLVYGEQTNNNNKPGSSHSGSSELRAGLIDALIVLATQTIKNDFLYQEAFLTTYRTFIKTEVLVEKLVYRFRKFGKDNEKRDRNGGSIRISRNAFSLLVRVVDGLADVDFQNKSLLEKLTNFITSLIEKGDLGLARALRSQFIMKYEERRTRLLPDFDLASLNSVNRRSSLLNFKSMEVAEQMTLLDSQLFLRIDSAELLIWVQEQSEEKSLNLTKFTEHFNNMSYWTRTLILQQPDAKERERYVMKFIKIMKWLRKMNNFNSYLAILSALDSAPIRRLEWQKNITDGLKEYCSLIDSSSSFRAYRLALGEASPPCIPYIGLVLQDLTFVQIGNPDLLDGKINFAKRWQQFNILDNLRRFKKEQYHIGRNEEIILFFGEFDDYLSEDDMWSLSETIKPRGQANKGAK